MSVSMWQSTAPADNAQVKEPGQRTLASRLSLRTRSVGGVLAVKNHPHLLSSDNAVLVVLDMQEPFLRNIFERERLVRNVRALISGATTLRLPIFSTTQYGKRMGGTIPELQELLPPLLPPFDKMTFSAFADPAFESALSRSGRKQVLLCGVESHICVNQTAHDLAAAGYQPHVVVDAISSRSEANWRIGQDKMRQGGTLFSSVELALYEMLQEAGTPEFKAILDIIK